MNIEKLDEAIAYIEAHPDQHKQSYWFTQKAGGCGTAMCLAGAVVWLDGWRPTWGAHRADCPDEAYTISKGDETGNVPDVSRAILGVTTHADRIFAERLFAAPNTIEDIKRIRDEIAAESS